MSDPSTTAKKAAKPHPDDQRCGNCASSRQRPLGGRMTSTDLECRWDGPPWVDKGVLPGDWCRRWSMRPAPKKTPAPKPEEAARG